MPVELKFTIRTTAILGESGWTALVHPIIDRYETVEDVEAGDLTAATKVGHIRRTGIGSLKLGNRTTGHKARIAQVADGADPVGVGR